MIKRAIKLFKWNLLTYHKQYSGFLGLTFIALMVGFFFLTYSFSKYEEREWAERLLMRNCITVAWFVAAFVAVIAPTLTFCNMKTKESRMTFLSLPASNVEKFLVRYVGGTVIYYVGALIVFILASTLFWGFTYLIGSNLHVNPAIVLMRLPFHTEVNELTPIQGVEVTVMLYLIALLIHASLLFFGTLFRKMPWLFSPIAVLLLVLFVSYHVAMTVETHLSFYDELMLTDWFLGVVDVALLLALVIVYWLTYRLFCRMQLVSRRRFFNI